MYKFLMNVNPLTNILSASCGNTGQGKVGCFTLLWNKDVNYSFFYSNKKLIDF